MKENTLCLRAKALQLPTLFDGPRYECEEDLIHSEDLDVRVASIFDVRKNIDCPFCCLLSKIMNTNRPTITQRRVKKQMILRLDKIPERTLHL